MKIALYAADTLAGDTVIRRLEQAADEMAIESLLPLKTKGDNESLIYFQGEQIEAVALDEADFFGINLLILPAGAARDAKLMAKAVAAGCIVVDASAGAALTGMGLPVMAQVNHYYLDESLNYRYFAMPNGSTAVLLPLLERLHRQYTLKRVHVTALQSVASSADATVEMLREQTIDLLNAKPVESPRVAYNVMPLNGDALAQELAATLNDDIDVQVNAARVPLFFGDSFALEFEVAGWLDTDTLTQLMSESGIDVDDSGEISVADIAGDDTMRSLQPVHTSSDGTRISCWVLADSVQIMAVNVVQLCQWISRQ